MSAIYPYYDKATGEYLFQGKWYPDYQSVKQAVDNYEEAELEAHLAWQEERKLDGLM